MSDTATASPSLDTIDIRSTVSSILETIDREREREIIIRRFGLQGRRETLEQIGELLGITRERVRQLEKAVMIRLRMAADDGMQDINLMEKEVIKHLHEMGRVARVKDLSRRILNSDSEQDVAHIAFIADLAPNLTVLSENDNYHHSVAISSHADEKKLRSGVDGVVNAIKSHGEPVTIDTLHQSLDHEHPDHVRALASVSKHLSHLRGRWGLNKWPTVNPKNIRDKIYVILQENGKPLHFSEIADAIKKSEFKRKDVTVQAIHNELIKDSRFVLIGRGIYALKEWGYIKGTVSDIIADVLRQAGEPLHRDEIVTRVLKLRHVKETTILLNLQSKGQFKRVAKATYQLIDADSESQR